MFYNNAMEIIYIDLHFLINLLADYLLCLGCARFCGLHLKRIRYFMAALLGAAYSVAVLLPGSEWLGIPAGKLLCALIMGYIAFGCEARPLVCVFSFLAVSAAFGGAIWAVSSAGGETYPRLSFRTLLLSFAICYAALSLFFSSRGTLPEKLRVEVKLSLNGRETKFYALRDSGNSLTDPVSGCRVMPVCPGALSPLFGDFSGLLTLRSIELLEAANTLDTFRGKFRLVAYSSLGGSGMLAAFRPDSVYIDGREHKELLVAVSPQACGDGFEGIF